MKLTFLGAARMVTGSCYLLETDTTKLLIDCGLFQGSRTITELNRREFQFAPGEIQAVLLTHAHIDHSGLLPRLVKEGFGGSIFCTKVTADLARIMLPDSAHIQEIDVFTQNKKRQRQGRDEIAPVYDVEDAMRTLTHLAPVPYNAEVDVVPGVRVRFKDAGHILGSSILEVFVREAEEETKLVFSGDLGHPDQPILRDPSLIDAADFVVVESTYGDRKHTEYDKEDRLAGIINETIDRGGNIIIPAFAVGRTQTMLYYFHKLFKAKRIPQIPIYIDSPLAISATDIFMHNLQDFDEEYRGMFDAEGNPLRMPQLIFTHTSDESKLLNDLDHPAIIISASGMADAGRILYHLKNNLWRPESSVLFVGYQAEGSMGRRLLEGVRHVKILGEEVQVRAKIHNLEGFSAHADQSFLLEWLGSFEKKPEMVFVVHGEDHMSTPFAALIEEKLGLHTYIPGYGDMAEIKGHQATVTKSHIDFVDPVLRQLYDVLLPLEAEYRTYKGRLEKFVTENPGMLSEVVRRLQKVSRYVGKVFGDWLNGK